MKIDGPRFVPVLWKYHHY